jgi:UDP-N-acetylmuramate--alanine ligase
MFWGTWLGDREDEPMTNPLSGGRIHIIGIGGIGMSAIAEVMAARGIAVQGSDQKDSANLRRLAAKGIKVFAGQEASNLEGVSTVVISTAIKDCNPELKAAREKGLPVFSRADSLAALMMGYRTIAVTGSHGKTTTTAMIAWMMERAGLDPTALVGGVLKAWGSNARIGSGPWMVVEADESDGTFIKLPAEIGAVTNIDPEHLDFYGTEAALHAAFETFFRQIPANGLAVAGTDNATVRTLLSKLVAEGKAPPFTTFGRAGDAAFRVSDIYTNGGSVTFSVMPSQSGQFSASERTVTLRVPGAHNALNAAAAATVGLHIGLSSDVIWDALSSFEGVDRRFTHTGEWNGVPIYDDYAHHPAEIEAVLSAARGAAKGNVIAVMQPHRFSRLESLFEGFCNCFREADMVLVAPVYAAGEAPNGFDSDKLVEGIRQTGHGRVYPIDGEDGLTRTVAAIARPGDLVISLGAGSITEWARALPGRLSAYTSFAGAAE